MNIFQANSDKLSDFSSINENNQDFSHNLSNPGRLITPTLHSQSQRSQSTDYLVFGKRLRHFRTQAGQTLEQISIKTGISLSRLSFLENGRREPKLSELDSLTRELDISVNDLLSTDAPDKHSALEIELHKLQKSKSFQDLGLPKLPNTKNLNEDTLQVIVGLARELQRHNQVLQQTTEEARRANLDIQHEMRTRSNYLPDIENLASELVDSLGHTAGALTHREVAVLAKKLGYTLIFVDDLPPNTRSITDTENGRIYLPPASIPGGHGLRALALQALAHLVLGHEQPINYEEFLKQRLEINYFASACLVPEKPAAQFLQRAKKDRNLAIEDLRDSFGVTHEAAAHRFTNLAAKHLDLAVHFYRTDTDGAMVRGYESDGLPFPKDTGGSHEGQLLCRKWAGRTAFNQKNRTSEFYQYTDTPNGTFWSTAQFGEPDNTGAFSVTCGVRFDDAKWFRGRDTTERTQSTCPDPACCRTPPQSLSDRWDGKSWASARMHAHVLSPLPTGTFPGVDDTEMFEFLDRHAKLAEE